MTTNRSVATLWRTLKEQEFEDDVAEIEAMSAAELDRYIAANGGDPKAIRASAGPLIAEIVERQERLGWHGEMDTKLSQFRDRAATSRTREKLPRAELQRRLDEARNDPRFAAPVAALFRKKTLEESTDEELQALLDEIALLAELEEE